LRPTRAAMMMTTTYPSQRSSSSSRRLPRPPRIRPSRPPSTWPPSPPRPWRPPTARRRRARRPTTPSSSCPASFPLPGGGGGGGGCGGQATIVAIPCAHHAGGAGGPKRVAIPRPQVHEVPKEYGAAKLPPLPTAAAAAFFFFVFRFCRLRYVGAELRQRRSPPPTFGPRQMLGGGCSGWSVADGLALVATERGRATAVCTVRYICTARRPGGIWIQTGMMLLATSMCT